MFEQLFGHDVVERLQRQADVHAQRARFFNWLAQYYRHGQQDGFPEEQMVEFTGQEALREAIAMMMPFDMGSRDIGSIHRAALDAAEKLKRNQRRRRRKRKERNS